MMKTITSYSSNHDYFHVVQLKEQVSCLQATDYKDPPILYKIMRGGQNMSYQDKSGSLCANSHPGSYSGQDAYNDMLITEDDKGGDEMQEVSTIVRRLTPL